jgi:hypothetical protein
MIYRKQGAVARWENGTLIRVTESGVAVEEGDVFTCHPDPERSEGEGPSPVDPARVMKTAQQIQSITNDIERLIISEGLATHDQDGRTWREHTERIHLSMTRGGIRAMLDLGSFDLAEVRTVAEAMARMQEEREAPFRLRLAPNVTAALLPALFGLEPPNVRLRYTVAPFRPSYRIRPVTMPVDLRLECDVTEIEDGLPRAVAILEPVTGLVLRVLVDDGRIAYPATVRVARIDAVARETVWYPYGGGSFGAEMML